MNVAAGFHSPHVRAARLLHTKKHRAQARCFLVEGPALVAGALDAGVTPSALFYIPGQNEDIDTVAKAAAAAGTSLFAVDARTLESLAQTRSPQGVVAQVRFVDRDAAAFATLLPPSGPALALVLHDLDDPGNAGTLVRSAEAFGAHAVCFGPHSVEPYNDKVVRATMGALFRIPLVRYESWEQLAAVLTAANIVPVGAAMQAADIRSVQPPPRVALVLGNERRGLEDLPQSACVLTVGIPQRPAAQSLNVAVAGSILLYELARANAILSANA